MKLDRYIIELLKLFEDNSTGKEKLSSYQLIPELLRGELASITWTPELQLDHNGQLVGITCSITREYYETIKQTATS